MERVFGTLNELIGRILQIITLFMLIYLIFAMINLISRVFFPPPLRVTYEESGDVTTDENGEAEIRFRYGYLTKPRVIFITEESSVITIKEWIIEGGVYKGIRIISWNPLPQVSPLKTTVVKDIASADISYDTGYWEETETEVGRVYRHKHGVTIEKVAEDVVQDVSVSLARKGFVRVTYYVRMS